MVRISEKVKESIILFRNYKEDKNQEGKKEEINFISSNLGITKKLAQVLADYSSYGSLVLVEWKGKKYAEDYEVLKVGQYPNTFLDTTDRFRALEIILDRITAEK